MEFITCTCIKSLSIVWSIDASIIADDNNVNGHVSSVGEIEHKADNLRLRTVLDDTNIKRQSIWYSTPKESQPTLAQLCGGK